MIAPQSTPRSSGSRDPVPVPEKASPDGNPSSRKRQVVPLTSSDSSQETLPTPPYVQRPPDSLVQTPSPSFVETRTDPTDPAEEGHSTPFQFRTPLDLGHSPIPIPVWRTRVEDHSMMSRVLRSAESLNDGMNPLLSRSTQTSNRGAVSTPNPSEFSAIPQGTPESTFRAFIDEDGHRWRVER